VQLSNCFKAERSGTVYNKLSLCTAHIWGPILVKMTCHLGPGVTSLHPDKVHDQCKLFLPLISHASGYTFQRMWMTCQLISEPFSCCLWNLYHHHTKPDTYQAGRFLLCPCTWKWYHNNILNCLQNTFNYLPLHLICMSLNFLNFIEGRDQAKL